MPVDAVNVPLTVNGVLPPLIVIVVPDPPLSTWELSIVAEAILMLELTVKVVFELEARMINSPKFCNPEVLSVTVWDDPRRKIKWLSELEATVAPEVMLKSPTMVMFDEEGRVYVPEPPRVRCLYVVGKTVAEVPE